MANMTCNQGSEWKAPLMLGERQNQKGVEQLVTPCEVRTGKRKQNLAQEPGTQAQRRLTKVFLEELRG